MHEITANMKNNGDSEIIFDSQGRWWCSYLNRLPAVTRDWSLPSKITIRDCTLREGEEMAGTRLELETKIELAVALQNAGLQELEVGYCGAIEEHEELPKKLRDAGIVANISSVNRAYTREGEWQREVDRAVQAGVDSILFAAFCNDDLLESVPWLSRKLVPKRLENCIEYAKSAGIRVGYALAATTRTRLDCIEACIDAAMSAGTDIVCIADSVGCALPDSVDFLVRLVSERCGKDLDICFHGHNTFGLALANALAAVRAGANHVDAVPLGIGEGAGIVPLEELFFALEVLYGLETSLDPHDVAEVARLVRNVFEVSLPPTKPIIGAGVYHHTMDSHVAGILRGNWHSWECIHPSVVGQERALELGYGKVRSGRSGTISAILDRINLSASDEQLDRIIERVRAVTHESGAAELANIEAIARAIIERRE